MSTAMQILAEHVSCSVCYEVLNNPHALRCLHTFCLECVQQITVQDSIQCPQCRDVSTTRHVKKDFKMHAFIEYYKGQLAVEEEASAAQFKDGECDTARSITNGGLNSEVVICGICQSKEVKIKCIDCSMYLCSGCESSHKRAKSTKKHVSVPYEIENEVILSSLRQTITDVQQELDDVEKSSKRLEEAIDAAKEHEEEQISEVTDYIDEMITDLECHRESLIHEIKEGNGKYINVLKISRRLHEKSAAEIQAKIDFLQELVNTDDASAITDTLYCTDANIREEIKEIKINLPRVNIDPGSPVCVMKGSKFDPTKAIEVKVHDVDVSNRNMESSLNIRSFRHLAVSKFSQTRAINLDFYPRALRMIRNNLWCVSDNAIHIYNRQCEEVKKICLKPYKIQYARALLQCHTGNIVIACSDNHGLIQIDINGRYMGKIIEGNFSDVATCNKKLYTLDYKHSKIIILATSKGKWVPVQDFKLKFSNTQSFDRLCAQPNGICISSCLNNCLYMYTIEGKLKYTTTNNNALKIPLMCSTDTEGNVLVADCDNHRFLTFHRDKHWHEIHLPGRLKFPTDAIVDNNCESLWIVTSPPNQLIHFTKV